MSKMNSLSKKTIATQLKRIEGQVRGIQRMVHEDRYCIDVLTQISAICASLHRVERDLLKNHISCCVAGAFKSGGPRQQQEKINEVIKVLSKINQ